MLKTSLTLEIQGGLGNQLFQLSALKAFCDDFDRFPIVDLDNLSIAKTSRQLEIPLEILEKAFEDSRICIQNSKMPRFYKKSKSVISSRVHLFSKSTYRSTDIGFQDGLSFDSKTRKVLGYFQSHRYADRLNWKKAFESFCTDSVSYNEIYQKICEEKPCALHIRGGDYLLDKSGIGNLGTRYYLEALVQKMRREKNIWVFTDDQEHAREILKGCPGKFYFPDNEKLLTPIESLLIFSRAKKILISNSTFAWWAAYLSDASRVYAPSKWFQYLQDPTNLIPLHWELIRSEWVTNSELTKTAGRHF
jgi:hypothetical protein